jgi:hypothetical protein
MWACTAALVNALRSNWKTLNEEPDAGYASEAVLVTALLIIGALIAIGILVAKVNAKANQIDLAVLVLQTVAR